MKKISLLFLVSIVLLNCDNKDGTKEFRSALMLTIENSMAVANFNAEVEKNELNSTGIIVPINKQIIQAVVEYKSRLLGLTEIEKSKMYSNNMNKFVNGDHSVFVLFFINDIENPNNNTIVFKNGLDRNVILEDDNRSYELLGYTKVFDHNFINGITKGYITFENFRKSDSYSYSITLSNLNFCFNKLEYSQEEIPYTWSASFDNTELEIMSLIEKGLKEKEIRGDLNIDAKSKYKLSKGDILNIMNTILTIVSIGGSLAL